MKRLFCLALLLTSFGFAQEPASGIVQVAINYGPKQDGYFSGVVVGDGRMVLTDAGAVGRAREIAIAFSDGEILETVMAQVQQFNGVAVLPMTAHHGTIVSLAPAARDTSPRGDIDAVAGGAPKAFQVDRRVVRLHPVGSGDSLRWQITPALPPQYRGGPLLSTQGQLIAIIAQDGDTLAGRPLGDMIAMVDVAAGVPPVKPAPAVKSEEAQPAPGVRGRPATPAATIPAAEPPIQAPSPSEKPAAPPEPPSASVFKDAAIGPPRIEAPVVPRTNAKSKDKEKPKPEPKAPEPAVKAAKAAPPPNVPWKARLTSPRESTMALYRDETVGPPPDTLATKLPAVRASWMWNASVRPPIPAINAKLAPIRSAWLWSPALPPPAPVAPPVIASNKKTQPPPKEDKNKKNAQAAAPPAPGAHDVDGFIKQAQQLMQAKEYPKAVDTLEEAVKQNPETPQLYFHLALAYWYKALQKPDGTRRSTMEKGSYHKAMKAFETFLEKAPNDPMAAEARMRLTVLRNAQYGGGNLDF